MAYDEAIHGKSKLGMVGMVPFLPLIPSEAQLGPGGTVHYRLLGDAYVRGHLPSVAPAQVKAVSTALKSLPIDDPSYSGSGTMYRKLTIEPATDGRTFQIKASGVLVGVGYVDAQAPIVSTDESMADQIAHGTESAVLGGPTEDAVDGEGDGDSDENPPAPGTQGPTKH